MMGFLAFASEEAKVQLSSVVLNLGSYEHQLLPPCRQSLRSQPQSDQSVYLRCTSGEVAATSALVPKISPLGLSPVKVVDDINKVTVTEDYSETDLSEQKGPN